MLSEIGVQYIGTPESYITYTPSVIKGVDREFAYIATGSLVLWIHGATDPLGIFLGQNYLPTGSTWDPSQAWPGPFQALLLGLAMASGSFCTPEIGFLVCPGLVARACRGLLRLFWFDV